MRPAHPSQPFVEASLFLRQIGKKMGPRPAIPSLATGQHAPFFAIFAGPPASRIASPSHAFSKPGRRRGASIQSRGLAGGKGGTLGSWFFPLPRCPQFPPPPVCTPSPSPSPPPTATPPFPSSAPRPDDKGPRSSLAPSFRRGAGCLCPPLPTSHTRTNCQPTAITAPAHFQSANEASLPLATQSPAQPSAHTHHLAMGKRGEKGAHVSQNGLLKAESALAEVDFEPSKMVEGDKGRQLPKLTLGNSCCLPPLTTLPVSCPLQSSTIFARAKPPLLSQRHPHTRIDSLQTAQATKVVPRARPPARSWPCQPPPSSSSTHTPPHSIAHPSSTPPPLHLLHHSKTCPAMCTPHSEGERNFDVHPENQCQAKRAFGIGAVSSPRRHTENRSPWTPRRTSRRPPSSRPLGEMSTGQAHPHSSAHMHSCPFSTLPLSLCCALGPPCVD